MKKSEIEQSIKEIHYRLSKLHENLENQLCELEQNKTIHDQKEEGEEGNVVGANSRLDEIQAGLLRVRLSHLKELTEERICLCENYLKGLENERLILPGIRECATSVWHQFVVRCGHRERLLRYLKTKGIETGIHYPIPPHLSEAYEYLGLKRGSLPITEQYAEEVLSLPLYNGMTESEQRFVIESLNRFNGAEE